MYDYQEAGDRLNDGIYDALDDAVARYVFQRSDRGAPLTPGERDVLKDFVLKTRAEIAMDIFNALAGTR